MRLSEFGTSGLPKKAGLANLHFGENIRSLAAGKPALPFREGPDIYLPRNSMVELFLLKGGTQFLLAKDLTNQRDGSFWFGGTDEMPFLVQMEAQAINHYLSRGEASFFDYLKPPVIKTAEGHFRQEAKRQGDIFAFPVGLEADQLTRAYLIISAFVLTISEVKRESVFGTRHTITGLFTNLRVNNQQLSLAEGLLVAEDHEPVKLEGLHLLAQTQGLFSPKEAD